MAVVQRVDPDIHPNGRCFVCGGAAEVDPDRDHATGYGCGDCGRHDLAEKDRGLFEAWIAGPGRRARLRAAVKSGLLRAPWRCPGHGGAPGNGRPAPASSVAGAPPGTGRLRT